MILIYNSTGDRYISILWTSHYRPDYGLIINIKEYLLSLRIKKGKKGLEAEVIVSFKMYLSANFKGLLLIHKDDLSQITVVTTHNVT